MINRIGGVIMSNKEILEKVVKITDVDYKLSDVFNDEYVLDIIADLVNAYERLKTEYDEYKEDIQENYELKKIDLYDEYGVSENDFH